ncbi:unnamed protein product, partial [Rotaria sp. Silwood1]
GARTIEISINNKFDKCINWSQVQIVRPDNVLATAHIEDILFIKHTISFRMCCNW